MKKIILVLSIAVGHMLLCKLISVLVLSQSSASAFQGPPSFTTMALVWTARVLYFPMVTLSLFPREWFPGGLVNIPIFLNSLIWGGMIGLVAVVVCKRKR
jgi:hypothetical protein